MADKPKAGKSAASPPTALPKSLEGHAVPPDRLEAITAHMAVLATTALEVNDELPMEADVSDIHAVMDAEGA